MNLGKDETYGAHRVGSVTKTFTTFLSLKLIRDRLLFLKTKCGDLIDIDILKNVFQNPDFAEEMTLEQLLSHTAGLKLDDHNRQKIEPKISQITTMQERFIYEGTRWKMEPKNMSILIDLVMGSVPIAMQDLPLQLG